MKRKIVSARQNWQGIVESQGFPFHSAGKPPVDGQGTYWYEDACYEFTLREIEEIENATAELHRICKLAAERIVNDPGVMGQFGIPASYHEAVRQSFRRDDPTIYGRFDLAYDGKSPPKLLEYNADTPTLLIESSLIQWHWLEDVYPQRAGRGEQFNSIHEKLIAAWEAIRDKMGGLNQMVFSSIKHNLEEFATVEYLRDTAQQAGINTAFLHIEDIGHRGLMMVDLAEQPIHYWFKLYPWEWIWKEDFGKHFPEWSKMTGIIEPLWKTTLSNKSILPMLWQMFPNHPNLLPAFWELRAELGNSFVRKPIFGREGGNIKFVMEEPEHNFETDGIYGNERMIYQKMATLPKFDGQYVVIGSWIVGDQPAGIIVREDSKQVIVNTSKAVPHYFTP